MSAANNRYAIQHNQVEHPGRKHGATVSSWIDQLEATGHIILLCRLCAHRFGEPKKRHYYRDRFFGWTQTKCDGCRSQFERCSIFVPEKYLTAGNGQSYHGHSWIPRNPR